MWLCNINRPFTCWIRNGTGFAMEIWIWIWSGSKTIHWCSPVQELRRKVTPLLKSFQAEVDSLSRRGRDAETAFLSGYRKIASIPGECVCFPTATTSFSLLLA